MPMLPHRNLVDDSDTLAASKRHQDFLPVVRSDRSTQKETWLRYHKIWAAVRDQQSYFGRSKTYLAFGRKIIESWVAKLKRDCYPTDIWFDAKGRRAAFEDRANSLKTLFDYFFRTHMQMRRKSGPHFRQLCTYGTAPAYVGFNITEEDLLVINKKKDPTGVLQKITEREKVYSYIGPTFRPVDLFSWYVWPVTVMDVTDATYVFEDQLVSIDRLVALSKQPMVPDRPNLGMMVDPVQLSKFLEKRKEQSLEIGNSGVGDNNKYDAERRRLALKGFTCTADQAKNPSRPVDTSIVWVKDDLGEGFGWYEVMLLEDTLPVRIRRNPWLHRRPPYLAGRFIEVINEFYGYGLPAAFDRLQYWIIDVMDQASDALTYSMNPIAQVDAYKVQDPNSIRYRPGAKWMAEAGSINWSEPPKETPSIGITAVSTGISMMNDLANLAPAGFGSSAGPRGRGKSVNTATGAQILLSESLVELRDVVTLQEDQVYVPLLRMMHSNTVQCMQDRSLILQIQGAEGVPLVEAQVSGADITGDFEFVWLGSLYAANQQVRAQQMVNFLQIASQIPPEYFQSQNAVLDLKWLLRAIWSDGFGLRNPERVVRDAQKLTATDPRVENELFLANRGTEVQLSQGDDDQLHAQVHALAADDPKTPPNIRQELLVHIQEHIQSFQQKQVAQAQAAIAQQLQGMLPGPGGNGMMGGNGMTGGAPKQGPKLNPGRPASTTSLDDVMRGMSRQ